MELLGTIIKNIQRKEWAYVLRFRKNHYSKHVDVVETIAAMLVSKSCSGELSTMVMFGSIQSVHRAQNLTGLRKIVVMHANEQKSNNLPRTLIDKL